MLLIDIQATIGIDFLSKTMYLEDRTVRLQLWWDFSSWCFRPVCIYCSHKYIFVSPISKIFIFWSFTAMVAKALRSGWTSGSILMLNQKKKNGNSIFVYSRIQFLPCMWSLFVCTSMKLYSCLELFFFLIGNIFFLFFLYLLRIEPGNFPTLNPIPYQLS